MMSTHAAAGRLHLHSIQPSQLANVASDIGAVNLEQMSRNKA
jgi:hypothetical protein